MPAQFCPRCHHSASRRYCEQCGLDLQPDKPATSVGDGRAARAREREWLGATTGSDATSAAGTAASAAPTDVVVRLAYWAQRARFLEHLYREARTQADALHAQCRTAGIGEDEIRRQVGALPRWAASAAGAPAGAAQAAAPAAVGGFAVAGFYAESGPDLDADGDVDGGLFDKLDQLFGG